MVDIADLVWIQTDTTPFEVRVYLYVDLETHKITSISQQPIPGLVDLGLEEHVLCSRWTIPNRAAMETYKRESSSYNYRSGSVLVDDMLLCDCVVSHHLEGLIVDGQDFLLQRDSEGKLDAPSIQRLKLLHSGIYDALYAKYCMEACLFA